MDEYALLRYEVLRFLGGVGLGAIVLFVMYIIAEVRRG